MPFWLPYCVKIPENVIDMPKKCPIKLLEQVPKNEGRTKNVSKFSFKLCKKNDEITGFFILSSQVDLSSYG